MSYILVIVESPAKCSKILSYLGSGYKVMASFGHLQELPNLKFIDFENNYNPSFRAIYSKQQQINKLKSAINLATDVILATDDDREGEAIAWHLCQLFNLPINTTKRIIFHEITKSAIQKAINSPTIINMSLVYAQQARQVLDLLVGYKISPLLWENISRNSGLSAGRCQTPALRLVYENQKEIDENPGKSVYNTTGYFTDKNLPFILNHNHESEDDMVNFLENETEFNHEINVEKPKDSIRKAPTPFTTSSLQQAANNEFRSSPKQTMSICQKLYEGGYITYMRTDAKVYSEEFINKTSEYIKTNYGEEYISLNLDLLKLNSSSKQSDSKKNKKKDELAQEAHEAIRPTNININELPKEEIFEAKDYKMYKLIWKNTIQSCMADSLWNTLLAKIKASEKLEYRYTAEQVKFAGFKILDSNYEDTTKKNAYNYLPLIKNKNLKYKKITSKVTIKGNQTHYTEAKLVQLLEKKGIGRPSTFSSIIDKIQERGYVKKLDIKGKKIKCLDFELENDEILEIDIEKDFGNEKDKLIIQNTGILVIEYLIKTFNDLFEYDYTKLLEDKLDMIANNNLTYYDLCKKCDNEINAIIKISPKKESSDIKVDDKYTYTISKHGPCLKYNENGKIKFESVRQDFDINSLKEGKLNYDDIKVDKTLVSAGKNMGRYQGKDLILKEGKFGRYVTWGDNKKSLANCNITTDEIALEDIIKIIEENNNSNILREINKNSSIRDGKYGHYIFYKTNKMTKPKFIKLNGFKENYLECDISLLEAWIKDNI